MYTNTRKVKHKLKIIEKIKLKKLGLMTSE